MHLSCAVVFSLSLLALPLMLGSRIQLMAICLLLGAAAGALYTCRWCGRGKPSMGRS
ncbi:Transporter, MFS superfamily [Klebsiella pneumoniae IS43]|uniref:Transporter, MFS superfamily n=1 Tax=Klebsiella pneumoniae IS43 TaxID=1432552 RepID=W1DI48_KLEPN|nr:Transporter, MFS superfamily [Klebsiella pneumoniae IS43]